MSGVKGIFNPRKKKHNASGSSSARNPNSPDWSRKLSAPSEPIPIAVSPITASQTSYSDLVTSNGYDTQTHVLNNNDPRAKTNVQINSCSPLGTSARIARDSVGSLHGSRERSGSLNSLNSSDYFEAPMVDQEDIIALTHHVRSFSEALSKLRNTFVEFDNEVELQGDTDPPQVKAHERLGEVLSILKGVLHRYPPLHSTDILASAGTLISKVKSHNYEDSAQAPDEFYESIDQLALAFSSSVSDFLMGDQELSYAAPSLTDSQSMDDLCHDELDELVDDQDDDIDEEDLDDIDDENEDMSPDGRTEKADKVDKSAEKAGELDKALLNLEEGVDIAMQRTKMWSKYAKDIATYVERRAHLEMDFSKQLAKLVQTTRAMITEEPHLPFQSIFITALDQDLEYASNCQSTYSALTGSKFMEPLMSRRSEHDRIRKDMRETWNKACKKLQESLANLKKAKTIYTQRMQELEKVSKLSDSKDAGRSSGKKKEDEARQKAEEAEDWYRQAVMDANTQQQDLESVKSRILVGLRQLVYQCDMTMKAATHAYFQMMNSLCQAAPVQFQTLAESTRVYEPGTQFAEYIKKQQGRLPQAVCRVYEFEPYGCGGDFSLIPDKDPRLYGTSPDTFNNNPRSTSDESLTADDKELLTRHNYTTNQRTVQAWSNPAHSGSDEETKSPPSLPGTPSSSPLPTRKARHSVSSENDSDQENKENDFPEFRGQPPPRRRKKVSGGLPFRNVKMSEPAKTHIFRKLRAPSRCRVCDSYLYFNGAECELCGLTCHKKCLEVLAILCGFKRLQRRLTTFGVDFHRHLKETNKLGNIPSIVAKCIDEIDSRAYTTKGIYRVSGVKSKVEKLCQVFENGSELVDLSENPPHLIASVLKLYLNQLPEPLLTFQLYPEFIKIAKESFAVIPKVVLEKTEETKEEEYSEIIRRLRELIVQLPRSNFLTGAKLMEHLRKVAEHEEESQMSASNLGIVFGPTLLRPPSDNTTSYSLTSLVDTPLKNRTVELLIVNWKDTFSEPSQDDPAAQETPVEEFQPLDPRDKSSSSGLFGIRSALTKGKNPNEVTEVELSTPPKPMLQLPHQGSRKISYQMGFGNEFFELLEKSNERVDKQEETRRFEIPEFLLPGSPEPMERGVIAEEEEDEGVDVQPIVEGEELVDRHSDESHERPECTVIAHSVSETTQVSDEGLESDNTITELTIGHTQPSPVRTEALNTQEESTLESDTRRPETQAIDNENVSMSESRLSETVHGPAKTVGLDSKEGSVHESSTRQSETPHLGSVKPSSPDHEEEVPRHESNLKRNPPVHLRKRVIRDNGEVTSQDADTRLPVKGPAHSISEISRHELDTRWPVIPQVQPVIRTISLESSNSDSSPAQLENDTSERESMFNEAEMEADTGEEMERFVIDVQDDVPAVIVASDSVMSSITLHRSDPNKHEYEIPPKSLHSSQNTERAYSPLRNTTDHSHVEMDSHEDDSDHDGGEEEHEDKEKDLGKFPIQRMSVKERLKEIEKHQKESVEFRQKSHLRPQRIQSKSLDKAVGLALRKQVFESESKGKEEVSTITSEEKEKPLVLPKPALTRRAYSNIEGDSGSLRPLGEANKERPSGLILELGTSHHDVGDKQKSPPENPTLQEFRLRMRQFSKPRSLPSDNASTSLKGKSLATKDSELKGRTFFVDKPKMDLPEHRTRSFLARQQADRSDNKIHVSPRLVHRKKEKVKSESEDDKKEECEEERNGSSTSHRPPTPKTPHHGDKFLANYLEREPKFV